MRTGTVDSLLKNISPLNEVDNQVPQCHDNTCSNVTASNEYRGIVCRMIRLLLCIVTSVVLEQTVWEGHSGECSTESQHSELLANASGFSTSATTCKQFKCMNLSLRMHLLLPVIL